ncbi:MAG: prepilin peptidase, partial [Ruminococcus sp.]|nr:prepilin peptidase [Ruminococcus sp.]
YYSVDLKSHIIGLFAASLPLLIIFLVSKGKAMGLGDVYLMAGAGLFLGTSRILVALMLGIVIGAVAGIILKRINGDSVFAFGPWLSVGILISMLFGFEIANWYMNFTGLAQMIYGEDAVMQLPLEPYLPVEY